MNSLDRQKYDPSLLTINSKGELRFLIRDGIPIESLELNNINFSLFSIYRAIKRIDPDIVVSTMAHMNFALLLLKPFLRNLRFVVREAITPSFFFQKKSFRNVVVKLAYKLLYPKADLIVSPARRIINEFKDDLGINSPNHRLLYNPVDLQSVQEHRDYQFNITPKRKETIHFIAAGRLHQQKGYDLLLKALTHFKCDYDWQLLIVGEGKERAVLQKQIDELSLRDRVKMPGMIPNPWLLYAESDCFLLPSRYEGLPNVVLESLACGTPVIASAGSGGIREIQSLSENGAVTVTDSMDDFIAAMLKVQPSPHESFRPSLLPDAFHPDNVFSKFEMLLEELR